MSNLLKHGMAAEDGSSNAGATLTAAPGRSDRERAAAINSRIETLPASRWHIKVRMIMGTATFFDAFDALSIAAALPVLMLAWHLSPAQAGMLIASGYVGQLIGAPFFGWLAERVGRLKAAMWSVLIFSLMSLVCASAWNLHSLMLFRAIQGFGLGGEVPIAATYINEMSRADSRGRFFMMYESVFMVGIIVASIAGAVIVPNFGWQYLFAICALPALLCVFLQRLVPESPRWLVSRGRLDEAEKAVARIQREIEAEGKHVPPPQTLPEIIAAPELIAHRSRSLFKGMYLSRTLSLWVLWFCVYFVAYGTLTWFPSIVRSQFGLSLQASLYMAVGLNGLNFIALGFAAFLIDRIGRKMWFAVASLLCAAGMLVLWAFGLSAAGLLLALLGSVTNMSSGFILYLYTPELYPTHNRSVGVAAATCWGRIAAIIGPYAIGVTITAFGLSGVYLMFGVTALVGAITAAFYGVRTEGRTLEDISP